MDKANLIAMRDSVKQQFDNLSNSTWVASQLDQLRGKFEVLNNVISSLEQEEQQNAADKPARRQANSNNHKGK